MKINRIGLHTFNIYNHNAMVSTVQFSENEFETMVLFDDGDELECVTTKTIKEAKRVHNELVNKYNDKVYEGSTAKLLGVANYGQFVKTVMAC